MAVSGTINLYELGFRYYHDPNLHYEVTPTSQIRINPSNGQAILYLGMRDYLVEGVRTRKQLKVVQGFPGFFIEVIDQTGDTNFEGIKSIEASWSNLSYCSFNDNVTAPERISPNYSPDTAETNDGTTVRVPLLLSSGYRARYKITNSTTGSTREVGSSSSCSVVLNKNEYISGVNSNGNNLLCELKSGIENAIKLTITFDLAYDFTGESRGLNLFTMPDTAVQVIEYAVE